MKFKVDWFLVGMGLAVLLAFLFPTPGAKGGAMHPEILTKAGVALIFFLHGVALPFEKLKAGTLRWPVHLVVQGCTFLLFPLLGLAIWFGVGHWVKMPDDLRLGFFYLCALPSTVSSSVAFTAAARGDVSLAVFNATLSSLLGVVLTPLWLGVVLGSGGAQGLPLGDVMLDLVKWLVLPLVVGQLSRPLLGAWAARNKKTTTLVDRCTILLLVYTSFCDSVKDNVWSGHGLAPLVMTFVGSLVIFGVIFFVVGAICDAFGFPFAERTAVVFCGSKKTLASGVPMARLIFGANPSLSVILLPIMIYHPLQLIICGWLAGRWANRQGATASTASSEVVKTGSVSP